MSATSSIRFKGSPNQKLGELAALVASSGAAIREGSQHPMYDIKSDAILLPSYPADIAADVYFTDLAHELIHWTRHPSRLNRDLGMIVWCDAGCAHEEVVAELGMLFLCAELDVTLQGRAQYIVGCLYWVQSRKVPLLSAARYAGKAVDYLCNSQARELLAGEF